MSLLGKAWKITPIYAIYNFGKNWHTYGKDKQIVGETFYSNAFNKVIEKYLGVKLKKDWIGRLYGVVNPNVKNGKYDVTSMIIEIDGNNTNNNEQVKNWAYKQLQLIAQLFKIEKLYDYISLEFKHVGPEEYDNYLFVFDIASRQSFTKSAKNMLINLTFWGVVAVGALILI